MLQTLVPLIKGLAEPSEGQASILKQSGLLLGNLTVIQAQLRQMDPGAVEADGPRGDASWLTQAMRQGFPELSISDVP